MIINKYTKDEIEKIYNLIINSPNKFILLRGGIAVGKTFYAKALACLLCQQTKEDLLAGSEIAKYDYTIDEKKIKEHCWLSKIEENYQNTDAISLVYFNRNTNYANFVYGNIISTTAGNVSYKTQERIFLKIVKKAQNNASQNYVLILDDINRNDFSSTMGDILSAIEASGTENEIHIGENSYVIPSNLYIIATYNPTIGCDVIDYAWQRRFFAYDIYSDERHIVSDEMIIRKRNNIEEKTFKKDEKRDDEKYELVTDYIYHIYMQVKIMCKRYLLESDADVKKRLIPGHGLFLTYDENKTLNENIVKFHNKLKYCIVPLLYQYLSDGLLDSEAAFDIEALEHLGDESWKCIDGTTEEQLDKLQIKKSEIKRPAIKMIVAFIGIIPDSIFYFFIMHNVLLMRSCDGGEKCFLFETNEKKYRYRYSSGSTAPYHTSNQYLNLRKKHFYSINLFSKENIYKNKENTEHFKEQLDFSYIYLEWIKNILRINDLFLHIDLKIDYDSLSNYCKNSDKYKMKARIDKIEGIMNSCIDEIESKYKQ